MSEKMTDARAFAALYGVRYSASESCNIGAPFFAFTDSQLDKLVDAIASRLAQNEIPATPNDDRGYTHAKQHHLSIYSVDFGNGETGQYIRLGDFNKVCDAMQMQMQPIAQEAADWIAGVAEKIISYGLSKEAAAVFASSEIDEHRLGTCDCGDHHPDDMADLLMGVASGAVEKWKAESTGRPFGYRPAAQEAASGPVAEPVTGKYADVLRPFTAMMVAELHANSGKGDRPGWLSMSRETATLEIYYHVAKLAKAARDNDADRIREHAADVANMSMMLVDVCGHLPVASPPAQGGGA